MRLYAKTILIIGITVLAIAAILLVAFEFTVMGSLSALEQEYASEDLHRAENSIYGEASRLSGISQDWGVWDDTYSYMLSGNPEYVSSNFAQITLKGLDLYAIALYDLNGTFVNGICSTQTNTSDPMSECVARLLQNYPLLATPEGNAGIILDAKNPLIVASHPILNTQMQGPSRGTIVIVSQLDTNKISELSQSLLQNITIVPVSGFSQTFGLNSQTLIQNNTVRGYQRIISDITGKPALLIQTHERRDLSRSGIYSRVFLIVSLFLLTIVFMFLASWLLNQIIISPLQGLNRDLLSIGNSGLLSGRIKIDRNDEIGDLASSINTMIGSLEQALQERLSSEHRLARLIELVEEGICLIGPDHQIWFANPAFAAILESTPHDLTGRRFETLFSRYEPDQNKEECIPTLETGQHEFHTNISSGKEIWVRITLASYQLDTGKMGQLCVLTDISQYRVAERELLLLSKKLSLLGSMTRHDIVNQLTTIRGMLGLIKRKNTDTALTQLIENADDAAEKINKHIEFSKEYQKAGIEEPRWQNIRTVWNLAYAMSRRRSLSFEITGDNYEIYADQLLQKVFFNLIENSLKHGKDLFYITISIRREGSDLLIVYEDDGGGVPNNMKDHIFDRGVGTGTGWGLFFVKEVLELTGMSIREAGTYGIGAVFIITVPEGIFRTVTTEPESDRDSEDNPGDQEHNN